MIGTPSIPEANPQTLLLARTSPVFHAFLESTLPSISQPDFFSPHHSLSNLHKKFQTASDQFNFHLSHENPKKLPNRPRSKLSSFGHTNDQLSFPSKSSSLKISVNFHSVRFAITTPKICNIEKLGGFARNLRQNIEF
jgi:hypothetical protein